MKRQSKKKRKSKRGMRKQMAELCFMLMLLNLVLIAFVLLQWRCMTAQNDEVQTNEGSGPTASVSVQPNNRSEESTLTPTSTADQSMDDQMGNRFEESALTQIFTIDQLMNDQMGNQFEKSILTPTSTVDLSTDTQSTISERISSEPIKSTGIWAQIEGKYFETSCIAAECDHSAWIEDERVFVLGTNDYGQCETKNWADVTAVKCGTRHTIGLTSDGKILFAGDNSMHQCELNVEEQYVRSIAASSWASYAVLENGRVEMCGVSPVETEEIARYGDIAAVSASESHVALLSRDGRVILLGTDANSSRAARQWKNIIQVECGNNTTIALDENGKVYVAGTAQNGQAQLDGIEDVHSVSAGGNFVMAVKTDGHVIGAGSNSKGQIDVSAWENVIAAKCGYLHSFGMTDAHEKLFAGVNNSLQQD